jgi:hypothetical protein
MDLKLIALPARKIERDSRARSGWQNEGRDFVDPIFLKFESLAYRRVASSSRDVMDAEGNISAHRISMEERG